MISANMQLSLFTLLLTLIHPLSHLPTLSFAQHESSHELSELDEQFLEAASNQDIQAASAALNAGADINARSTRGMQTALMQSVLFGREEMVKFLLEKGADTTIPERDGYTPMHGAGFQGRAAIADMLRIHGVSLRDKHTDGFEPAVRSCWGPEDRHTDTVKWFLDNGVPLEDIYDTCIASSHNPRTKALLEERKSRIDEL